jgi:large conductance mechanosensitive channel
MNYGLFINQTVTFLIVAACVFMIVRVVAKMQPPAQPKPAPFTKSCQFCATDIPLSAKRCPHCTSQL